MKSLVKLIIVLLGIQLSVFAGGKVENSLSLDECIDLAVKHSPTINKSSLSFEKSKISTKQAYSNLYPQANIALNTGSVSTNPVPATVTNPYNSYSMTASINQSFYSPGLFPGLKIAKLSEESAKIGHKNSVDQIRSTVEYLYFSILSSQALIKVYDENIQVAEENILKVRAMYELGTRTESDVLKSEVQKGDFESQLLSEKQNLLNFQRTLNIELGRNPYSAIQIKDVNVDNVLFLNFDEAKEKMLKENADLKLLHKRNQIQALSLKAAKQAYLPSLSASYSYNQGAEYGNDATGTSSIGISANINLFNGFNTKHSIEQEKVNVKTLQVEILELERNLEKQLLEYYTQLETFNELVRIYEKSLESSRRDQEIVMQQYQIGSSTILDQMNAQLSVLRAQSTLVKVKYSKKILESQIIKLLGS